MGIAEELRKAKGLLSVKQVAEALGSQPQTTYSWATEGRPQKRSKNTPLAIASANSGVIIPQVRGGKANWL